MNFNPQYARAMLAACFLGCLAAAPLGQSQDSQSAPGTANAAALSLPEKLDRAIAKTLEHFSAKRLDPTQLAATIVDLSNPARPIRASYRGDVQIYPASVIKLFYLVALHHAVEIRQLQWTDEIQRAARDMIVDSSNDATHYLVDLLTGTTSGPELPPEELEAWYFRRNAVNRYFASLGYTQINANRKPWCEGPYGRESQSVRLHQPNHRNWLTTDAAARLMTEIVTGNSVTAARSQEMMRLLERDPFAENQSVDDQARGFTGRALVPGDKLWSKAGWTSDVRHDAAYVELAGGAGKFVLVVFTTGHAQEREIIPHIASRFFEQVRGPAAPKSAP